MDLGFVAYELEHMRALPISFSFGHLFDIGKRNGLLIVMLLYALRKKFSHKCFKSIAYSSNMVRRRNSMYRFHSGLKLIGKRTIIYVLLQWLKRPGNMYHSVEDCEWEFDIMTNICSVYRSVFSGHGITL